MSRVLRFQMFWLSQYLSAPCLRNSSEMGNLLREPSKSSHIFDESPDGGGGGTGEISFGAKTKEWWKNLVLSEIGMFFSNSSNFFKNESIPETFSFGFWSSLLFGESVDLLSAFEEVLLPEKEGSPLGFRKSFESGVQTALFPERKNSRSFQSFLGDHISVS